MKRVWAIGVISVSIIFLADFFWWQQVRQANEEQKIILIPQEENTPVSETREVVSQPSSEEEVPLPVSFLITRVPFTVQAPNAEWNNPLFQDACEEASMIMAEAWVNKKTLSRDGVKKEIESLALFEKKHFGQAVDTSLVDTNSILREYFSLKTIEIKKNIVIDDMKRALALGRIVIVPTDGRKLKNPHFKQPGPERHMVVVKGYDRVTREFIVNDPGTHKGEGYHYNEDILYEAILDYATGDHAPVTSTDKVMLTVRKE